MRTATKIKLASLVSQGVAGLRSLLGRGDVAAVRREGVLWSLDLKEGIDLALYLGVFERSTRRALGDLVTDGMTVLDIGANIGAHTLYLTQKVGREGCVIAFEPTD